MKRRILSLLIAIAMVVSVIPMQVFAADTTGATVKSKIAPIADNTDTARKERKNFINCKLN